MAVVKNVSATFTARVRSESESQANGSWVRISERCESLSPISCIFTTIIIVVTIVIIVEMIATYVTILRIIFITTIAVMIS